MVLSLYGPVLLAIFNLTQLVLGAKINEHFRIHKGLLMQKITVLTEIKRFVDVYMNDDFTPERMCYRTTRDMVKKMAEM